ncbi:phosphatase domain-containing protein [Bernardetia sp. MNP-M8]|uniref:App1 family protein n=1 Tax=Bernardetia sp. MNP-M8 TaxID=3127470 RepID=UPI0030D4470E
MNLKDIIHKVSHQGEQKWDILKTNLKTRLGLDEPVMILPYRSFGNTQKAFFWGRVLEDEKVNVKEDDKFWDNILNTYRRLESDEIPNVRLSVTYQGITKETKTDEEGYFFTEIELSEPITPHESMWEKVEFKLLENVRPNQGDVTALGEVQIHDDLKEFGIISDIDDTVLQTQATSMLASAKLTFLGNAHLRKPFLGVGELYEALVKGSDGSQQNPLYFVSSSMWNLYDLLTDFFEIRNLPKAPLLLRDLGLDDKMFFKGDHSHKEEKIKRIFSYYPNLKFILIGDSGQHDAEIYYKMLQEFPERIKAIYIRDVSDNARDAEVDKIATKAEKEFNVPFQLIADSGLVALHAASQGFITKESIEKVQQAKEEDKKAPLTLEEAVVKGEIEVKN